MIYNLRRKFILVSAFSVSLVFVLIFGSIYIVSTSQLNATMDIGEAICSRRVSQ